MSTCPICGIDYWPASRDVHNGIHGTGTILGLINLGEGATPEAVEAFRQMWKRTVARSGAREKPAPY